MAVIAQALLVRAITAPSERHLIAGALTAGLSIGLRSQSFILTLPLLALALFVPGASSGWRGRSAALGACAVGVILWGVPLLVVSGGLSAYLGALGQQGGEDFGGVVMFWNFPTIRVGLSALQHTFISPWASVFLAAVVLLAAAAGTVAVARDRRVLLILAVMAIPYAVFHLLFHETVTVRYALAAGAGRGVARRSRSRHAAATSHARPGQRPGHLGVGPGRTGRPALWQGRHSDFRGDFRPGRRPARRD